LPAALAMAWAAGGDQTKDPSKKTTPAKKTTSKATAKSAKSTTAKSTSKKKAVATAPHRSSQQQPTADRYREIQQALVDKGYFNGPADGTWGPSSVDALKRFQRDQSLVEDGKIGSMSLIALGLGPKREMPAPDSAPRSIESSPAKLP
jgi:peptidoglycan hydrolase-like protein with peptidoglycan-binding domain